MAKKCNGCATITGYFLCPCRNFLSNGTSYNQSKVYDNDSRTSMICSHCHGTGTETIVFYPKEIFYAIVILIIICIFNLII